MSKTPVIPVADVRNEQALKDGVTEHINKALYECYKLGASLGYDEFETRMIVSMIVAQRTYDIALEEHRKKVDPTRQLNRLIKALENKCGPGSLADAAWADADKAERQPAAGPQTAPKA